MSAKDDRFPSSGAEAASEFVTSTEAIDCQVDNPHTSDMKRAAAKLLIERYYYQLTDGCGNPKCTNEVCASSGKIKGLSPNDAAAQAIQLFMKRAQLCDPNPAKVAKLPTWPHVETVPKVVSATSTAAVDVMGTASQHSKSSSLAQPSASLVNQQPSTSSDGQPERDSPNKKSVKSKLIYLNEDRVHEMISICKKENTFSLLIRTIGQVYSSAESLMRSFRKDGSNALRSKTQVLTKEDLRAMEVDQDKDTDSLEELVLDEEPGSPKVKNTSAVNEMHNDLTLDLEALRRAYAELFAFPELPFQGALINALLILSENAELDLRYHSAYEKDPDYLNIFIVVLEIPTLQSEEFLEMALPTFCKAVAQLPVDGQARLAQFLTSYEPSRLKELVEALQQLITLKVIGGQLTRDYCVNDDEAVIAATKVMKIFYYANILGGRMDHATLIAEETEQNEAEDNLQDLLQGAIGREQKETKPHKEDPLSQKLGVRAIDCRKPLIPFEEFYNEPLSDQMEMDRDFAYYNSENERNKFSFMNHSFILTPATKSLGLYYDNRIRMYNERRFSMLQSFVNGAPPNPYLKLKVRRDHIIDDALIELEMLAMDNPNDLKKQLVVEFEGEQGIDEGGVSKEFFQLVVEEIFKPDFAMFTLNQETSTHWFNPTSFESDGQFTLIGIVLGLAIYNNIILDVHFPSVVYRKLLGKKGTFEDLQDLDPVLYNGLQDLLNYQGNDIDEVFMHTYRIGYTDIFGVNLTYDLKENGEQISVSQENKREFVDLYADFLLNKSVEKQFRAFRRGFQMVTDESPLKLLFRPAEVEMLVCGSKIFDFNALEDSTEYDGGYTSHTPIIRHFWALVHDFSDEEKRKLLQFTTGSDRAPVGGLSKLKLIIARNGPDSDRLPTAHTCFNVLLLPEYASKEKLEERLQKAINYFKGFGML